MRDILLVYKQVELQFDENGEIIVPDGYKLTITVSYDEKPGIQAIANTSDGLRPKKGNGEVCRDYEYKRLGTVSPLAGIDLLTGEAIPLVGSTHKSSDFIEFLKILDKKYPAQCSTRACLKNHSCHLHSPLCVRFAPNSGYIARYAPFIWRKSPTNCEIDLTESIFQTRSSKDHRMEGWLLVSV